MDISKHTFVQTGFINCIQGLKAEDSGKWGKMNAQQMVEHVADFFQVSTQKIQFPLITPEEQLPKYREFLYSEKIFRENTKIDLLPEEPLPVKHGQMQDAIQALKDAIADFLRYFENDPLQTTLHPIFGNLNFEEWVMLHFKHTQHHARQFDCIAG